jgi:TM2 domain-containing membrane protein YozV
MTQGTSDTANKKIAAGICGIMLGAFGVHKFILGYTNEGIIALAISLGAGIITCGLATMVMSVIGLVEGIIYLTKTDDEFYNMYIAAKKGWF